jgi:hypothetical protein
MSDETPVNNDQTTPERTGQQTPSERTFTQAELDQILTARLSREREKYVDYDAIKSELETRKTAEMSEVERLQKQLDDERKAGEQAKADADIARLEMLRLQVATEKGLPAPLASRLQGTTKEALEADADGLLELVKLEQPRRTASSDAAAGTRQLSTVEGLTDTDRVMARKFGLTDAQYLESKKHTPKGFLE